MKGKLNVATNSSIGRYFRDHQNINIPLYQRPYEYGDDEVAELYNSFGQGDLGTISLKKTSVNDFTVWNLIDGQQKTLTLYILAKVYEYKFDMPLFDNTNLPVITIENNYENNDLLRIDEFIEDDTVIFNNDNYREVIMWCLCNVEKDLKNRLAPDESCIVVKEFDEEADESYIFNAQNNTGRPLTPADIAKNILYAYDKERMKNTYDALYSIISNETDKYWPQLFVSFGLAVAGPNNWKEKYTKHFVKDHIEEFLTTYTDYLRYIKSHELGSLMEKEDRRALGYAIYKTIPLEKNMVSRWNAVSTLITHFETEDCSPFNGQEYGTLCRYVYTHPDLSMEDLIDKFNDITKSLGEQNNKLYVHIPTDAYTFKTSIAAKTYSEAEAKKILFVLENIYRKEQQPVYDTKSITVEHIWPKLRGTNRRTEADQLGNLTLLSSKANTELGKKPYTEKRSTYQASSYLITNKVYNTYATFGYSNIEYRTWTVLETLYFYIFDWRETFDFFMWRDDTPAAREEL